MRVWAEIEFEADYHEDTDGKVKVFYLTFPGCAQNLLHYITTAEQKTINQLVQEKHDAMLEKKLAARRKEGPTLGQYRSPDTGE